MVVRLQSNARLQINSASIQLADEEEISMQKLCDLAAKKTYTIFATQISKHGVVVQLVRIPACHALSHLDNLRCHLLQVYSSLLFTLRDVWDGGV